MASKKLKKSKNWRLVTTMLLNSRKTKKKAMDTLTPMKLKATAMPTMMKVMVMLTPTGVAMLTSIQSMILQTRTL